ncbi:MAG: hypothetical protein GWO38_27220, partial [Phycisphaerae bacterium]|nr:hypothetical protein [Phycisphaerae bacterium]NIX01480.1 hypothetical protein [Phycisphaerae bacterium]NIX31217.1 hypothetical protein [Phycisphaerae bacterium]
MDTETYPYDAAGLRVYKEALEDTTYIDGDIHDGNPTDWYTTGSYWD